MEIEILDEKQNKILERYELQALIRHEGEPVPSRDKVLSKLAALRNKERDQVVLIKMNAKYGIGQSDAVFHVYNSAKRAKKVERPYILKRSGIID